MTTTAATTFAPAPQFQNLTGLPFTPTFTAATFKPGQWVAVATSAVSGTNVTASSVFLVPQPLNGTVSAVSTSGGYSIYTVTLTTGSAFSALSGATSVVVYTNSTTMNNLATPIAVGSAVRFNGLVFNDAGTFRMVSGVANSNANHDH